MFMSARVVIMKMLAFKMEQIAQGSSSCPGSVKQQCTQITAFRQSKKEGEEKGSQWEKVLTCMERANARTVNTGPPTHPAPKQAKRPDSSVPKGNGMTEN